MAVIHGFRLEKEKYIKELNIQAEFFRHVKTGAELLSLQSEDENKVFGITFRTPPSDSTGLPHILEHSVLCGSRKYPIKEPFVELLKGSLQTFLNAFTYPDKTCYPVASQNLKDFYNLIDVYLDAVFYPRLTPFVLQQEGWHYELEDAGDPLIYKGVVFNEMKGAYSSPDSVLSEQSLQSLFPDNAYGFDSGGDPRHIPNLTFRDFQAFHKKYYHPTNSRIYFYGDDDPVSRLKIVDEYLKEFEEIEISSSIELQPSFLEPRHIQKSYMVGDDEGGDAKGMVTVNWLLGETSNVETNFALIILDYILLGMPASPLRKALIDSGLGEDIAGDGLGNELREIYFSTGLKGVKLESLDSVEALVMDILTSLAQKGIDPQTVEAALNTIEFRFRENNTGHFPRGLLLMLRSLTTWLYERDPISLLGFEDPLKNLKSNLNSNPSFFEQMIKELFLENSHRTTLKLKPDPALGKKLEADEQDKLAKIRSAMSPKEVETIITDTHELKAKQETPDSPEALASIPMLALEDLDKKNKTIPMENREKRKTDILYHDQFTNGIAYVDLGLNLHTLPADFLPYVSLFGRALLEIGTESKDFVTLIQHINSKTGGIFTQTFTSSIRDSEASAAWLFLRGKALTDKTNELFSIFKEVLLTVKLDNKERFQQMLLEEKSRCERKLVPAGHQFVSMRLKAQFAESHWAAEQMGGLSYLFFLRHLADRVEEDWPGVLKALEEIRSILVNRETMLLNVTLDKKSWSSVEDPINEFLENLPLSQGKMFKWSRETPAAFEGMIIPSQINYVGKGINLYESGYEFNGSAKVITRYIRNAWLWDQVRVLGGAYGAFCLFDRLSGVLVFVSYRDPNLIKTLDVFDQTPQFLRDTEFTDDELKKSIIGAIGDLDAHMLPDAKGYASMLRFLIGETEESLQVIRDEILGTEKSDFQAFSKTIGSLSENGIVKVLGSPSAIETVNVDRPGWLEVINVL